MRIGILTLRLHTNYGGILQAYALQTILESMGHSVVVFNQNRKPIQCSIFGVVYCFICRCISSLRSGKRFQYYNVNDELNAPYKEFLIKTQHTQKFVEKYIHSYYVRSYVAEIPNAKVDCIIVGSDQIWNRYNGDSIDGSVANAFLSFVPETIKRFSYAASFGHDDWQYSQEQTAIAKDAIKKFVGVSVRETTGVALCNDYLGCDAQVHLDPTMLLESKDYVRNLELESVEPSAGDLLVYILDSTLEKDRIIDFVERTLNLRKFIVNSKAEDINDNSSSIKDKIQPPVKRWLRGFMDAKFVVTDSFHACVFSILFHKPFVVVGNKERGLTRFSDLLAKFGLERHLVNNVDEITRFDFDEGIDFEHIEEILAVDRQKSFEYITTNLSL